MPIEAFLIVIQLHCAFDSGKFSNEEKLLCAERIINCTKPDKDNPKQPSKSSIKNCLELHKPLR